MILTEKETAAVKSLISQEENCIKKYAKYAEDAHDTELKSLFKAIQEKEERHKASLEQVLSGSIPSCNCNDKDGKEYSPKATYGKDDQSEEKKRDCFLASDCIGTEKMISTDYNTDVFEAENSDLRKLFADILVEEQNHGEMIYKYKQANHMA